MFVFYLFFINIIFKINKLVQLDYMCLLLVNITTDNCLFACLFNYFINKYIISLN